MKKLLALLSILVCLNTKAQTNVYHPFPDIDAVWNETNGYYSSCCTSPTYIYNPHIFFIAGDTLVSGLHYKKLLSSGYQYEQSLICCYYYNQYGGAIRQDSLHKKVYYCKPSTTEDTLLYDFNLSVGDTLPMSYINNNLGKNFVSSIDSILIGTSYRKQYHISTNTYPNGMGSWDSNYVQLIEGIGSTFGLLYQLAPPFEASSVLNCFSQNNAPLFINSQGICNSTLSIKELANNQNFKIYPNPSNGNFIIETSNEQLTEIKIYDVTGKLVLNKSINGTTTIDANILSKGVYTISITSIEGTANKKLVIIK